MVTPLFRELHESTYRHVEELSPDWITISTVDSSEQAEPGTGELARHFQGWKAFCRHARQLNADHGLLMYFDHFQLPVMIGPRSPCPFSAIYFRPTFHYRSFANHKQSWKDWFMGLRKSLLLKGVLRTKELERLYCLDPFAADYIAAKYKPRCEVVPMSDSFVEFDRSPEEEESIRQRLQVEPGRKLFLLLGVLDPRKGVKELLRALPLVSPVLQSKICIAIIGHGPEDEVADISQLVEQVRMTTKIQVVFLPGYIQGDVQPYYWVSDVVLTTYQGHMGSSGAIMRAAYAGKPVLSSDYGLMGEWVYRCKLGQVVDTTQSKALASGLEAFVSENADRLFDPRESQKLKERNSQTKLAEDLRKLIRSLPANDRSSTRSQSPMAGR